MSNKKSNKKVPEKETRTRTWTFVIYPESAPLNWRDKLDGLHIEWVESPLHDKDLNASGEAKKPHIHILLLFGGVKSYEQVKEIKVGYRPYLQDPSRVHRIHTPLGRRGILPSCPVCICR